MRTQTIDIKTPDGLSDAFIAYPDDNGTFPAVLFFMDGFGPRPHLYAMATTIAARGYYVLLPNFFYRVRRAPVITMKRTPLQPEDMPPITEELMALLRSYDPASGLQDTGVFLDFLTRQRQVQPGRVCCSGYCFGGGLAIRAAARFPDRIKAVASFHAGRLATDQPDSPHLLLGQIKAELYIGHADNDRSMPPQQIEVLEAALERSGLRFETELYPGAMHSFTMADLPAYNEEASKHHWQKLFDLLERHHHGKDQ